MDIASLRSAPVRRLLLALNQGTIEDFIAVFTPDATFTFTLHGDSIERLVIQ